MLSHSISTHTLSMDWRWCMFHHYQQHSFNCETCLIDFASSSFNGRTMIMMMARIKHLVRMPLSEWNLRQSQADNYPYLKRKKVVLDIRKSLRDTRVVAHYFRTINCWPLWMCIMPYIPSKGRGKNSPHSSLSTTCFIFYYHIWFNNYGNHL